MNDTIYREQAIAEMHLAFGSKPSVHAQAVNILNGLPSAEKHGKWIRITQGADPEKYMCPFCHRTIENYGEECFVSIRYPYCHCGARMVNDNE